MNLIQAVGIIIGSILVPVITLLITFWMSLRKEIQELKNEIKIIERDIKTVDTRLTRMEGRFEERGYWESRIISMEEMKSKKKVKGE